MGGEGLGQGKQVRVSVALFFYPVGSAAISTDHLGWEGFFSSLFTILLP